MICFYCWKSNAFIANEKMEDDEILPYLTCNFQGCKAPVSETFTLQLLEYPEKYHFYQHLIIRSFIHSNPLYKWCPNKANGCNLAVKIENIFEIVEEITCECGLTFCFKCTDIPHSPFPCILIQKWKNEMEFREIAFRCSHCFTKTVTDNFFNILACSNCKNVCTISDLCPTNPNDYCYYFQEQSALLKNEFQQLTILEKHNDHSKEFFKTSLKFINYFRQKSLYFYAFCHFLENGQIFAKFQFELRLLFNTVTDLLISENDEKESFVIQTSKNFTTEKKMEILDLFVKIQNLINANLKSFYEDDWKFSDKEIEKAMIELK
uniref:RING-type domain-containing protein n=1 Tax=Panagrolaimus sp. PS1159 TaxID=55785 RepID=A0AC35GY96_9BILA